jgi:hypothetical protein
MGVDIMNNNIVRRTNDRGSPCDVTRDIFTCGGPRGMLGMSYITNVPYNGKYCMQGMSHITIVPYMYAVILSDIHRIVLYDIVL